MSRGMEGSWSVNGGGRGGFGWSLSPGVRYMVCAWRWECDIWNFLDVVNGLMVVLNWRDLKGTIEWEWHRDGIDREM